MGFFDRFFNKEKKQDLDKGLEKTKTGFFEKISKAIAGKSTVDVEILDGRAGAFRRRCLRSSRGA